MSQTPTGTPSQTLEQLTAQMATALENPEATAQHALAHLRSIHFQWGQLYVDLDPNSGPYSNSDTDDQGIPDGAVRLYITPRVHVTVSQPPDPYEPVSLSPEHSAIIDHYAEAAYPALHQFSQLSSAPNGPADQDIATRKPLPRNPQELAQNLRDLRQALETASARAAQALLNSSHLIGTAAASRADPVTNLAAIQRLTRISLDQLHQITKTEESPCQLD